MDSPLLATVDILVGVRCVRRPPHYRDDMPPRARLVLAIGAVIGGLVLLRSVHPPR
ncbi:hypothetical protein [Tsukamurella soli]|uniref:hypothetical protein n=1 Tax=Tsukamurella soli TaxID=644556 RepID=UPI0031F1964D